MPNWNTNRVTIFADTEEVKPFLAPYQNGDQLELMFNMHKIFPETFPKDDTLGQENWNYDWATKHTGSKWFPNISEVEMGNPTILHYDTARTPNNRLLLHLSEITGWNIINEYEEAGV